MSQDVLLREAALILANTLEKNARRSAAKGDSISSEAYHLMARAVRERGWDAIPVITQSLAGDNELCRPLKQAYRKAQELEARLDVQKK